MKADDVVDAMISYIRSSDSAIMGSKGPRRKALVKALETFVDERIRKNTLIDAVGRSMRGDYDG